jgi:hypothetical protein
MTSLKVLPGRDLCYRAFGAYIIDHGGPDIDETVYYIYTMLRWHPKESKIEGFDLLTTIADVMVLL